METISINQVEIVIKYRYITGAVGLVLALQKAITLNDVSVLYASQTNHHKILKCDVPIV